MKKQFLFVVLVALVLTATSCEKESTYSCDSEVDTWVKENVADIQKMTRSEWKQLDVVKGRACYRAFTEKQKVVFWQEKFDETLALGWNGNEREHIGKLLTFVNENPQIFGSEMSENESLTDKLDLFMYEWSRYAKEELKWSRELIGAIAASGYDLEDKTGGIQTRSGVYTGFERVYGDSDDCECNRNNDFCFGPESNCVNDGCDEEIDGCGWIWRQECNGVCRGY